MKAQQTARTHGAHIKPRQVVNHPQMGSQRSLSSTIPEVRALSRQGVAQLRSSTCFNSALQLGATQQNKQKSLPCRLTRGQVVRRLHGAGRSKGPARAAAGLVLYHKLSAGAAPVNVAGKGLTGQQEVVPGRSGGKWRTVAQKIVMDGASGGGAPVVEGTCLLVGSQCFRLPLGGASLSNAREES